MRKRQAFLFLLLVATLCSFFCWHTYIATLPTVTQPGPPANLTTTTPTVAPTTAPTPAPIPLLPAYTPCEEISEAREPLVISDDVLEALRAERFRGFLAEMEKTHMECGDGQNNLSLDEFLKRQFLWAPIHSFMTKRYYIVALLHNNENLLPFWCREVIKLAFLLGRWNVFVSIYESGSSDDTKRQLGLFREILSLLEIRHSIVLETFSREGYQRIEYLAECRNRAMRPFAQLWSEGFCVHRIIFLNDVFFCAFLDVLELLSVQGDMLCGTDWHIDEKGRTVFYDIWVSKDVGGLQFSNSPPHTFDLPSRRLWEANRPFQVFSCWNGVVSIDPEVFFLKDLHFRSHRPGECAASECELFARDLWRRRRSHIAIVPRVRVAYSLDIFKKIQTELGHRVSPSKKEDRVVEYFHPPPPGTNCFPLRVNQSQVRDSDAFFELFDMSII